MLAETCVFDKQSLEPIFCGPQQLSPPRAPLIANLRGQFAEFLNHRSPERLSLLDPPTCVSFSTVNLLQHLEAFLGRPSGDYRNINVFVPCFRMSLRICLQLPSTQARDISIRPLTFQTPSLHQSGMWRRNVDLLSIVYAFRPRLRNRLTLGGFTFPRKP